MNQTRASKLHRIVSAQGMPICQRAGSAHHSGSDVHNRIAIGEMIVKNAQDVRRIVGRQCPFALTARKGASGFDRGQQRRKDADFLHTQKRPDPIAASFCDVVFDQSAGIEVEAIHQSPRSSMTISEAGLPGTFPRRLANLWSSFSDIGGGGTNPAGRGRTKP